MVGGEKPNLDLGTGAARRQRPCAAASSSPFGRCRSAAIRSAGIGSRAGQSRTIGGHPGRLNTPAMPALQRPGQPGPSEVFRTVRALPAAGYAKRTGVKRVEGKRRPTAGAQGGGAESAQQLSMPVAWSLLRGGSRDHLPSRPAGGAARPAKNHLKTVQNRSAAKPRPCAAEQRVKARQLAAWPASQYHDPDGRPACQGRTVPGTRPPGSRTKPQPWGPVQRRLDPGRSNSAAKYAAVCLSLGCASGRNKFRPTWVAEPPGRRTVPGAIIVTS